MNGIWLCSSCAHLIDSDEERFPYPLLRSWKQTAEATLLAAFRLTPDGEAQRSDFILEEAYELKREVNVRFGFSFLAPEGWNRWDPQNGDGTKFAHPENEEIEIRGWGGHAILHDDLGSSVEWLYDALRSNGYFELLSQSDHARSVSDIGGSSDDSKLVQQAVKAIRMVYRCGKFTCLHIKTRVGGTEFDVRCQVPSERYAEFRLLFVHVTQSLRVLGVTMAEHAQNKPEPKDLLPSMAKS